VIEGLTFLLLAQLAGEITVHGLGVPVPGPVMGLIYLAVAVGWRGIPPILHETAHGILRNLSLLFVPAGVGIMGQTSLLADNWLALATALVVSTLATLAVTVLVFRWAQRQFGEPEDEA